jgi:hypothetical protein
MDPESERPLRLFVNPFTMWTQFALKTGEAMWASAHAAAVRANAPTNSPRVAVIPTADAPAPKAQAPAAQPAVAPAAKPAEAMVASAHAAALRKAKAPARQASKAARFKATRAKLRSKANAKRRTRR